MLLKALIGMNRKYYRDNIVEGIVTSVIVLFLHSRSDYHVMYFNKEFQNSYDVVGYFKMKPISYSFFNNNNKLVNIYYEP